MTLSELPLHTPAEVDSVQDLHANDAIARRLRELGFVKGEEVRLVAKGPVGGEPLLVQVGFTRFALRISEAKRVVIDAARQESRA
ncbi:FeoA family protein [Stenotrophomonas sp. YAU14A_MKIMI4_1]|uniref:FeoA family protein n=1 Tax=Stenotrophomonas sp. YAU14A_MKIMI4_1 TaxID=2072408 RepID=UPI000D53C43B|nr:FeoA family protein [Stenotrophomonas sp. YAU14A_MKIMI4_1]AWH29060.1 ferrous iron transport protein A [Stenotrophomonas sp. YAU14A_MKIMI4_1]